MGLMLCQGLSTIHGSFWGDAFVPPLAGATTGLTCCG